MSAAYKDAPKQGDVDFVFGLPASPVTLSAILPEGGIVTQTFAKSDAGRAKAAKWIATRQAEGRNVYYQHVSTNAVNKRLEKSDAAVIHFAHADLDLPHGTPPAQHAAVKAALIAKLENFLPMPTAIIDSGGGAQALWELADPMEATP
jgi:Mesyanzhinovviridae DNA primase